VVSQVERRAEERLSFTNTSGGNDGEEKEVYSSKRGWKKAPANPVEAMSRSADEGDAEWTCKG